MSERPEKFILINPGVRGNALLAVRMANDGDVVTVAPAKRSEDQSAYFHAICSDLEKSPMQWFGKRRKKDEWKTLLVSAHTKATGGEVEVVPGIEGELVNIRESSSNMGVGRMKSLIEYSIAFCVTNKVDLHDTRRSGFRE